jgi:hypothetical protein
LNEGQIYVRLLLPRHCAIQGLAYPIEPCAAATPYFDNAAVHDAKTFSRNSAIATATGLKIPYTHWILLWVTYFFLGIITVEWHSNHAALWKCQKKSPASWRLCAMTRMSYL